jgi:GT2 family glycosyltransferase
MVSILIINLNNLEYTKSVIEDLEKQDSGYSLTIVDQNSSEPGTIEYLSKLPAHIEVFRNLTNIPISRVWNWFAKWKTNVCSNCKFCKIR